MPNQPQKTLEKKPLVVPKTDVSQDDDKSTRRFVFYMVALIILIIIIGGGVLYWLVGDYIKQTNKNKAQDKTIELLEQKKKDLVQLKPNYDKIIVPGADGRSQADLILNAVPDTEGYKEIIAMVERMGRESGVLIPSVTKSATPTPGGTTTQASTTSSYQIAVNIGGTFTQLLDFITKTEKSSRVMNFVTLSISGSTKSGVIASSATFMVYYQLPANINSTEAHLSSTKKENQ